jgi:hypothetical protein
MQKKNCSATKGFISSTSSRCERDRMKAKKNRTFIFIHGNLQNGSVVVIVIPAWKF